MESDMGRIEHEMGSDNNLGLLEDFQTCYSPSGPNLVWVVIPKGINFGLIGGMSLIDGLEDSRKGCVSGSSSDFRDRLAFFFFGFFLTGISEKLKRR
jgi:hypothetical protein